MSGLSHRQLRLISRLDGSCQVATTPQGQRKHGTELYRESAKAHNQAMILRQQKQRRSEHKHQEEQTIIIYIPRLFPPVWGVAENTQETTKTMGVLLRFSGNDEGLSRVWMAMLEQHSPSSPIFHNFRRFMDANHRVASIRQPRGNSRCQSELCHNHSPLIPHLPPSCPSSYHSGLSLLYPSTQT